jgi:hypothetical protein
MPYRSFIVCALVLGISFPVTAQNSGAANLSFRWLDRKADAALFGKIQDIFANELKPDDPEAVKPQQAQLYKYLARIGVVGANAIVLIGERDSVSDKTGDYFLAFNLDTESGAKSAVSTNGFRVWKFRTVARLESSQAPDIFFTYASCRECEADYFLASFRFNPTDRVWKVRSWNEKDDEILIGSDTSVGAGEGDYDTNCVYSIADFDGDGFDDVAVRCVETLTTETGKPPKVTGDTMKLYSVKNGEPKVSEIHDPIQMSLIRRRLCAGSPKSPLCKSR